MPLHMVKGQQAQILWTERTSCTSRINAHGIVSLLSPSVFLSSILLNFFWCARMDIDL